MKFTIHSEIKNNPEFKGNKGITRHMIFNNATKAVVCRFYSKDMAVDYLKQLNENKVYERLILDK